MSAAEATEGDSSAGVGHRHLVGDMDISMLFVSPTQSLAHAPLTDAVRAPSGCAGVGLLTTMVDVAASDPAMAASAGDWTTTLDVALYGERPVTEGPVVVATELARAGKKVVVVAATVYDGHGQNDINALGATIGREGLGERGLTRAASGVITFARIPRTAAPGMAGYDPIDWIGQVRHMASSPDVGGTIYERTGMVVVDADTGALELAHTPYVSNSIGTINGGAQAVLVEAAAEAMRPGMIATDLQLRYLSQVKAGPARTTGQVLRDAVGHSVVAVRVVDGGNGNQLLSLATVTLQMTPAGSPGGCLT